MTDEFSHMQPRPLSGPSELGLLSHLLNSIPSGPSDYVKTLTVSGKGPGPLPYAFPSRTHDVTKFFPRQSVPPRPLLDGLILVFDELLVVF